MWWLSLRAAAAPMSPEAVQGDFEEIVRSLEGVHINPTDVLGRYGFREAVEETRAKLETVTTDREFWLAVAPFIASVGDGHTYLQAPYPEDGPAVPVRVAARGDTLVLLEIEGEVSPVERPITSLDGRDASEVLREMRAGFSGEYVSFRNAQIDEMFPRFYPWWATRIEPVVFGFADGSSRVVPLSQLPSLNAPSAPTGEGFRWQRDGSVMVLDVDHFDGPQEAWVAEMKAMFREMRKQGATALVIDVRDNPGGNSGRIGALAPHLLAPWRVYSEAQIRVRNDDGTYTPAVIQTIPESHARLSPRFDGPVYVLTNTATFSAATDLAVMLSDYDRATIVGEPPGRAPTCTGNLTPRPLPSGMMLYVASARFVRAVPERGEGPLRVDLATEPSRALEVALAHARSAAR